MARLTAPNGATVSVSDEKAKRLLGQGYTALDGGDSSESPASIYDGQKPADLAKLAKDRGLEVTGTGANGRVKKDDLIAALTAADEANDNGSDGDGGDAGDDA